MRAAVLQVFHRHIPGLLVGGIAALEAAQWAEWDGDNNGTDTPPVPVVNLEEEEERDEVGRFDRFALSGSLEGLMDQSFLKVVQLRRKFGFGWAGAEVLYNLCEKAQMKPEDVLQAQLQVGRIPLFCIIHIPYLCRIGRPTCG